MKELKGVLVKCRSSIFNGIDMVDNPKWKIPPEASDYRLKKIMERAEDTRVAIMQNRKK